MTVKCHLLVTLLRHIIVDLALRAFDRSGHVVSAIHVHLAADIIVAVWKGAAVDFSIRCGDRKHSAKGHVLLCAK